MDCLNLLSEYDRQCLLWFTPVTGTDKAEKLELPAVLGAPNLRAAGRSAAVTRPSSP